MKTEGQVRHKLQQVTYRHLQRTVRKALSCRPENCIHNGSVTLPTGEVRFCNVIEVDGSKVPCDEAFGGLEQASRCPQFALKNSKESVQEEFAHFLKTSDVATIAARYPDVAALLWVIDASVPFVAPAVDPDPPSPPAPPSPSVTRLYLQPEGGAVSYTLLAESRMDGYRVVAFPSSVAKVAQHLSWDPVPQR